jgi:hypothetical protein
MSNFGYSSGVVGIIMTSWRSAVTMNISPNETFDKIALRFCSAGHGPYNGIHLYFSGREVSFKDTATSLRLKNGDTVYVKW